jgi:hypothetical protein
MWRKGGDAIVLRSPFPLGRQVEDEFELTAVKTAELCNCLHQEIFACVGCSS